MSDPNEDFAADLAKLRADYADWSPGELEVWGHAMLERANDDTEAAEVRMLIESAFPSPDPWSFPDPADPRLGDEPT